MPLPQGMLLCLGMLLMTAGGLMALCVGLPYQSAPFFGLGLFLGLGGIAMLISGLCMAMKNLQVAVPGHFLLHPRTGTRFSPQQALAIQRYAFTEERAQSPRGRRGNFFGLLLFSKMCVGKHAAVCAVRGTRSSKIEDI